MIAVFRRINTAIIDLWNSYFYGESSTITAGAFVLGVMSLVSRVIGLFRDRFLAARFGAGEELDIYYTAFRIPDFFYTILLLGVAVVAFVPTFVGYWEKDPEEAKKFFNTLFTLLVVSSVVLASILFILSPWIIPLIAPGFNLEAQQKSVALSRIMFLSAIFLGVSSLFSGITQVFKRFFAFSLAPVLYNVGIIIGVSFFEPHMGLSGLAWGVVLGALMHTAIQLPVVSSLGFSPGISFDWYHEGVKKVLKHSLPRTLSIGFSQLTIIVLTALASYLAAGSISIFQFSNNLAFLPVGMIGLSYGIAAFPSFTRSRQDTDRLVEIFRKVVKETLFLVVPLSVLFIVLRAQIVRVVLGAGQFDWTDTRLTAASIAILAVGIFAQSLLPVVIRAFYALGDTKTPLWVSIFGFLGTVGLGYFLGDWLHNYSSGYRFLRLLRVSDLGAGPLLGLVSAFSFMNIVTFTLLYSLLRKKLQGYEYGWLRWSLAQIVMYSVLAGSASWIALRVGERIFYLETFTGILMQGILAGLVGLGVYALLAVLARQQELIDFKSLFRLKNNQSSENRHE